jgi:hypothetical protein
MLSPEVQNKLGLQLTRSGHTPQRNVYRSDPMGQLTYSSNLNMEATYSSETSADFQGSTRHNIPEDRTLHNHRCENLNSHKLFFIFCAAMGQLDVRYVPVLVCVCL